ncbi:class I SAM-dependent methyltransferase [Opitutus terrae]|uniref:Methyltransferase type 11 domain-containing protein n=1 Tax=Opitutus terrae (strain DSM 11246 / JCM 15787 / PB90-1) TaxID=452637 RepID=B1ZTN0_OPITP|nr:class I SAM-dependent methyltransferase [Opitutus terrae]ACB74816.1 conserved hypothetical protein [Opitutus terrae PB90-1]
MPALAVAPPELELPSISFVGRSLNEYAQFFALDPATLRGKAVLDVGAGASSFVAEACRRGADAVAVDPLYGAGAHRLAERVKLDFAQESARMRARPRRYKLSRLSGPGARWPRPQNVSAPPRSRAFFSSFDEADFDRRAAAQRFLADYEQHFAHGRYVSAALPQLPFLDRAFDLVLCAHLLFTPGEEFDFSWHVAALGELARVSASEVRIHPLCGPDGRRYTELERLQRELLTRGIPSAVVPVPYEFYVGGSTMLVLNPEESAG